MKSILPVFLYVSNSSCIISNICSFGYSLIYLLFLYPLLILLLNTFSESSYIFGYFVPLSNSKSSTKSAIRFVFSRASATILCSSPCARKAELNSSYVLKHKSQPSSFSKQMFLATCKIARPRS